MIHQSAFTSAVYFEPITRSKSPDGLSVVVWAEHPSEECGCPERELTIGNTCCLIHFEPDGEAEIHLDFGDFQDEIHVNAASLDDLQAIAIRHVERMPSE